MITRTLHIADLPGLNELAALSEAEGFRFVRRFVDDLIEVRVRLDDRNEFFLAAIVQDRLVGIGGVTPDSYLHDPEVGRLRHLYVRADMRRTGIGRTLVAHLESRAQHCYTRLRLRTDAVAAAQFYERLGYESTASDTATHHRDLSNVHVNITWPAAGEHDGTTIRERVEVLHEERPCSMQVARPKSNVLDASHADG